MRPARPAQPGSPVWEASDTGKTAGCLRPDHGTDGLPRDRQAPGVHAGPPVQLRGRRRRRYRSSALSGQDGVINVSFTELTLNRTGIVQPTARDILKGYNSVQTFSTAHAERARRENQATAADQKPSASKNFPEKFMAPSRLRRAVRPLRQFLQRRSGRRSQFTKTPLSASAPRPRPCSATRACEKAGS